MVTQNWRVRPRPALYKGGFVQEAKCSVVVIVKILRFLICKAIRVSSGG